MTSPRCLLPYAHTQVVWPLFGSLPDAVASGANVWQQRFGQPGAEIFSRIYSTHQDVLRFMRGMHSFAQVRQGLGCSPQQQSVEANSFATNLCFHCLSGHPRTTPCSRRAPACTHLMALPICGPPTCCVHDGLPHPVIFPNLLPPLRSYPLRALSARSTCPGRARWWTWGEPRGRWRRQRVGRTHSWWVQRGRSVHKSG